MGFTWDLWSSDVCGRLQSEAELISNPVIRFKTASWGTGGMCVHFCGMIICISFFFFFFKQVVTNRDTQETLLCMACVFEVSNSEHGAQHHIYRLVKDWTWLFIYIDICIYTHICAHTHTLSHSWTTDCKPHHTGWCPVPEVTPTFLNPVWVKSFFPCVHNYHCSCEVLIEL
jgi:hypothetical protein